MKYLEVVFNIPLSSSFTYSAEDSESCTEGVRVTAFLGRRKLTGYVLSVSPEKPDVDFTIKPVEKIIDREPVFGKDEVALASWMAEVYYCSLGEALGSMLPGGKRESSLPSFDPGDPVSDEAIELSNEQKTAVDAIVHSDNKLLYLFGITGSGKTEVFLQAANRFISEGKSVIYLVPEISLTHQLSEGIKHRFKERIAILHSSLTPSQRLKEWVKIKKGGPYLVIGARSAVFAPVEKLGMIVIDEEHEGSYKSGSTPRYHARQVAMRRAKVSGAKVVMGSATPSLEAHYLTKTGVITRLELTKRLSGGKLPESRLVNMSGETSSLSRILLSEIKETLDEGKQVILFLNRRGFSYFFHCRSCGYEMTCSHCSVPMTFHKERNRMICHYCGYSTAPISSCPECGSLDVGYSGFGTELVEDEIKKFFPYAEVRRVDSDSVRKKNVLKTILKDFYNGKINILLGTQMVAKGLNFPGVKLVGIILADSTLHVPDFRAGERTFSLITQVSGRAGRYTEDGRVIIQTYDPENPAIKYAVEGRQEDFYREELEMRKLLNFPPYVRLFRLVFRGKNKGEVEKLAERAAVTLRSAVVEDTEYLGPSECPISRIAGNYRSQIIIRTNRFSEVHRVVGDLAEAIPRSSVYVEIDIDPVSLM